MNTKTLTLLAATMAVLSVSAAVRFDNLFCDHAVLQRGQAIPVWGYGAAPSTRVLVTLGETKAWALANADGLFRTRLPAMTEGGPYELVATDEKGEKAVAKDVYVGEVWLASGQSNMEFAMKDAKPGFGEADRPLVRVFTVRNTAGEGPVREATGKWRRAMVGATDNFTAVGTFFAMKLQEELGCAVGVIAADWGGTHIEPWMSRRALMSTAAGRQELAEYDDGFTDALKWLDPDELNAAYWPLDEGPGEHIAWAARDLDESDWIDARVPGYFHEHYKRWFNGAVWYRKEVEIPADWAGKDLVLEIPGVDKMDIAWFDGVEIGRTGKRYETKWHDKLRRYPIAAKLVRGGKATVVVRVWSQAYAGGIVGEAAELLLKRVDGKGEICLAGDWKSKVGKDVGCPKAGPQLPIPGNANCPTALYDSMIHPLVPYAIKGAIWYQGESNGAFDEHCLDYGEFAKAMIADWRAAWGQGDFAFCFTELACFGRADEQFTGHEGWSEVRAAMLETTRALPNCGIASARDLSLPGKPGEIHPPNKLDVGNRLARWALATQYGRTDLVPCGPRFSHAVAAGGKLVCHFTEVGSGLVAKGTSDGAVTWCHVAGFDGVFHPAEAKVDGNTLVVSSPKVPRPLHVRYAWAKNPEGANLYNKEGLPACAFRW